MTDSPSDLESNVAAALAPVASVRVAYLFGSQLTGRTTPRSDLDVAVLYDRALDAWGRELARRQVVGALTDKLGALGGRADVVDLNVAASSIAFHVISAGRRVVERDREQRIDLEAYVMRRYDDDAPRRALFARATIEAARRAAPLGST